MISEYSVLTHDCFCREHRSRSTDPAITPPSPDCVAPGIPADFPWAPSTYPIPEWASIPCPTPPGLSGSHCCSLLDFSFSHFLIMPDFLSFMSATFELTFLWGQNIPSITCPNFPGLFCSSSSLFYLYYFYI